MLCFILLAIVLILVAHYFYLLFNSDYWSKKGIFCPNPKLFFGNLPNQIFGKRHITSELDDLYQQYKDKHSFIGIFNFRKPRWVVFEPEILRDIFIKHFKNFQGNEFTDAIDKKSDPLFGNHPFFLINDEWRDKRAEFSPAFTTSRMKATFSVSTEVCSKMVEYVKEEQTKDGFNGFDIKDLAARFAITVVSKTIYGIDANAFGTEESEILKVSSQLLKPNSSFMINMILTSIYPFLSKYLKVSFSQPGSVEYFTKIMADAVNKRAESKILKGDYLEYLMNLTSKKEIGLADLATHGVTFLTDGYETSSAAIASTLYELARNTKVQDKLREELKKAMPNDEDCTYDKIMDNEYLDLVWNENLRIHPPGSFFFKMCTEDIEVEIPKDKKISFKKGEIIYVPLYSIQHDEEFYDEPKKFKPERFSAENGGVKAYKDRFVFFPFGDGPRICVGQRFAIMQAKIAITSLIRKFKMTVNEKTPEKPVVHPRALVYYPMGSYWLNLNEIADNEE